jgi:hypothetical protein
MHVEPSCKESRASIYMTGGFKFVDQNLGISRHTTTKNLDVLVEGSFVHEEKADRVDHCIMSSVVGRIWTIRYLRVILGYPKGDPASNYGLRLPRRPPLPLSDVSAMAAERLPRGARLIIGAMPRKPLPYDSEEARRRACGSSDRSPSCGLQARSRGYRRAPGRRCR